MVFIITKTFKEYQFIIHENEKLYKLDKQHELKPILLEKGVDVIRGISYSKIYNPFNYSLDTLFIDYVKSHYITIIEDKDELLDSISICKRCGKAYVPEDNFVEDTELLEAINRYINVDIYCPFCIEEIDDKIYEFVEGLYEEN